MTGLKLLLMTVVLHSELFGHATDVFLDLTNQRCPTYKNWVQIKLMFFYQSPLSDCMTTGQYIRATMLLVACAFIHQNSLEI